MNPQSKHFIIIIYVPSAPTCEVVGVGVYPSVAIVDARSDALSSAFVWRHLQIDSLNQKLHTDLTPTEEKVTNFKGLLISNESVEELDPFVLDFGVSPSTYLLLLCLSN